MVYDIGSAVRNARGADGISRFADGKDDSSMQRTLRTDEIDPNFHIERTVSDADIVWRDVRKPPFSLYGLYDPVHEATFKRLPDVVAHAVSEKVTALYRNTAGGRVRFSTDSDVIAIRALMPMVCNTLAHMPLTGSAGFDLYVDDPGTGLSRFWRPFIPPCDMKDGYESAVRFSSRRLRHFTIHFPSYSDVAALFVGVRGDASLGGGMPYRGVPPVVYYGSSITQGACASRPGNSYQNILARRTGLDYLNFGFSGAAYGEEAISTYLATLPMCAFVSDYDHNAPNVTHLRGTHERLYRTIRHAHPTVPYIMLSRHDFDSAYRENILRRDVVIDTYRAARADGDTNVYYIDGASIFRGPYEDMCTVDGVHPNDLGFALLADAIGAELKRAFTQINCE